LHRGRVRITLRATFPNENAMPNLAQSLVAASAVIIGFLGTVHLVYTFATPKFDPRDPALKQRMQEVSPRIAPTLTMWNAWIGFNASHSFCAMLFGAVYGFLALCEPVFFFGSRYLVIVGAVLLLSVVAIAVKYWFRIPTTGIIIATACYLGGIAVAWS
jgi:hypothetical protein